MFLTFMELTLKIVTRNDFFFNLANVLLLLTLWLWPLTCYIEKLIKSGHYHYQLWSIQCIFGFRIHHYNDVIMSLIASQISSLTIVYSTFYSGADQRKHQSASLASVRGIQRGPVNSPHKGPVTRKIFPFDDVIMTPFMPNQSRRKRVKIAKIPNL